MTENVSPPTSLGSLSLTYLRLLWKAGSTVSRSDNSRVLPIQKRNDDNTICLQNTSNMIKFPIITVIHTTCTYIPKQNEADEIELTLFSNNTRHCTIAVTQCCMCCHGNCCHGNKAVFRVPAKKDFVDVSGKEDINQVVLDDSQTNEAPSKPEPAKKANRIQITKTLHRQE